MSRPGGGGPARKPGLGGDGEGGDMTGLNVSLTEFPID